MLSADSCSAKIHTRVQRETGPETIQILVQHRRQSATPPTMSCFSINSIRSSCLRIPTFLVFEARTLGVSPDTSPSPTSHTQLIIKSIQ